MEKGKKEGFLGQKQFLIPENILKRFEENPLIKNLFFTDIGYYPKADNHYRQRSTGAKEYILIYCIEGNGSITYENKKYQLTPNSFFIIPPDTKHSYGADITDPWSIYWIHFTGDAAHHLYERFLFTNSPTIPQSKVKQIPYSESRIHLFKELMNKIERGFGIKNMEYINIRLWCLLSSFIYYDLHIDDSQNKLNTGLVDSVVEFMKSNLHRSLSVDEIADQLNYSTSHLHTLFKKESGYSPIQYYNHLKIQKGCQYLSFTGLSIKEISFKLGFNDPLYFSRLFKNLIKLSPSAYREKHKTR